LVYSGSVGASVEPRKCPIQVMTNPLESCIFEVN